MRRITWEADVTAKSVQALLPRSKANGAELSGTVAQLIEEVRSRGALALKTHAEKFDGVVPENFRVPPAALQDALSHIDSNLRGAIEESIRRVRVVSQAQMPKKIETVVTEGGSVSLDFRPVDSAGVYVPG